MITIKINQLAKSSLSQYVQKIKISKNGFTTWGS
jgi:hypothetical protein